MTRLFRCAVDKALVDGQNARVFRLPFEEFVGTCVARIARGEGLSQNDAAAFGAYLEARERAGHRLLGRYAGEDEPFDTVTGRCGHPPAGVSP